MGCGRFVLTGVGSGGDALRRRPHAFPGQQLIQPVDRMLADACEDIAQPGLGLEAVELGRSYQRVEDRGPVAAGIAAGEQPVLAAERDGPAGCQSASAPPCAPVLRQAAETEEPGPAPRLKAGRAVDRVARGLFSDLFYVAASRPAKSPRMMRGLAEPAGHRQGTLIARCSSRN